MSDPQHISGELSETLESLRRTLESNPREPPVESTEALPVPITQLPLWPEHRRAAPNALFRSALFPALNFQQGRGFLKNQQIASVGNRAISSIYNRGFSKPPLSQKPFTPA
jgi:hypothetical protein